MRHFLHFRNLFRQQLRDVHGLLGVVPADLIDGDLRGFAHRRYVVVAPDLHQLGDGLLAFQPAQRQAPALAHQTVGVRQTFRQTETRRAQGE